MSELTSLKIQNSARELEEKKVNERKKSLLYLILNYLKENGFSNTTEAFLNEAQLTTNIDTCDNIDLDIILQEYLNYYFLKFKKYPKITKKNNNVTPTVTQSTKLIQNKLKISSKTVEGTTVTEENNEFKISVKSLLPLSGRENEPNSVDKSETINLRPLYDFIGFNSDWKDLANMISKEIIMHNLNVKWDDVKGLENVKNLLKEAVLYPLEYPNLFTKLPVPWRGILVYGPPGTGKTYLAKALATQCRSASTFFNISSSTLVSKWRGESEKLVRVLFELAKYQSPSIIFIDEIDALASKRDNCNQHEASRRFKSELLIQMDGINYMDNRVFLLATSNLPWDIDSAVLRRFEKRILIDYPSFEARQHMFQYYLKQFTSNLQLIDVDYQWFAESTVGYTGSDIKMVCKEAALLPIRQHILNEDKKIRPVTSKDVLVAIENTKPSTKHLAEKYYDWHKDFGCI